MPAPINGFIKIHRKLIDWEWYQDSNVVRVFLHLLLKANHKDQKWQGIAVKRGQHITSYQHLAHGIGDLSIHQVRTALDKLKMTGEVTSESTSLFTVITIRNYDEYQSNDKQSDKRMASEWQASGKRVATNKNDKNDKNENNDKNIPSIKIEEGMKSIRESLAKKGILK